MTPPDHATPPGPPLDDGPLDDDTLAVHAVIDDEATPEQRRRVARDPALVAMVADGRAAVAAMAQPVTPLADDTLAAIRRRALDAALDDAAGDEPEPVDLVVTAPRPPTDIRAPRRPARRLPPLPAVAAVVVLLVVVGVGLLVAGRGSQDESADRASTDASEGDAGGGEELSDETLAEDDDQSGAGNDAAEEDEAEGSPPGAADDGGPAAATRDELLTRATATYADEADLLAAVRQVDPETLRFDGSPGAGGEQATTVPPDDDLDAQVFASDPVATRCDDVLRAGEPDLEAAVAATIVDLDGAPVLVLTTAVPVSDDAPTGFRLTLLNAVDCSPRGAVLR